MAQFLLSYSDIATRFSQVLQAQYVEAGEPKFHLSKIREAVCKSWGYQSFADMKSHAVDASEASEWHLLNQDPFPLQYLQCADQKMGPSPFHIQAYKATVDHFVAQNCLICSIAKPPRHVN
ncbi:hypothetical protein ACFSJ3_05820 [Corallincola platygyrae]|uniref:Uncharacterized protein n=1 Tax=Corallincola platygyrae TaxID=1193278 RepID=A0ABW4XIY1_9GAMM